LNPLDAPFATSQVERAPEAESLYAGCAVSQLTFAGVIVISPVSIWSN
jgi:hypothetical protein